MIAALCLKIVQTLKNCKERFEKVIANRHPSRQGRRRREHHVTAAAPSTPTASDNPTNLRTADLIRSVQGDVAAEAFLSGLRDANAPAASSSSSSSAPATTTAAAAAASSSETAATTSSGNSSPTPQGGGGVLMLPMILWQAR